MRGYSLINRGSGGVGVGFYSSVLLQPSFFSSNTFVVVTMSAAVCG